MALLKAFQGLNANYYRPVAPLEVGILYWKALTPQFINYWRE